MLSVNLDSSCSSFSNLSWLGRHCKMCAFPFRNNNISKRKLPVSHQNNHCGCMFTLPDREKKVD